MTSSQEIKAVDSQPTHLWSKPHHGVQHLGRASDRRWATVEEYSPAFAVLTKWLQGHFWESETVNFDSAAEARTAGEAWVERAS